MALNLARTLSRSAANGPGERFVVWVQGCPLACPGCWNADTWSFGRRHVVQEDALVEEILATDGIEGVTFSGGEPFMQARALARVAARVRAAGLSVFVFTGYAREELTGRHAELLAHTDVLVSGRYREELRVAGLPWRGSTNQQVDFLTNRYGPEAMGGGAEVEILLGPQGATVTGFPVEIGQLLPC